MTHFFTNFPKNLVNSININNCSILVNTYNYPNKYELEVFLPNINKEDISITHEYNVLQISITAEKTEFDNLMKEEFQHPSGVRKLYFPDVDFTKSESLFEGNILKITLLKSGIYNNSIKIK